MTRIFTLFATAAGAAALSACAVQEARIAMPPHLAPSVERLEVTGMGGGTGGNFHLAGVAGRFSRGAERFGVIDPLLVGYGGGGRFEIAPSPIAPALSGECSYREGQMNVGPVSVAPRPLTYHCALFGTGGASQGRLLLGDRNGPLGALHGRSERGGMLDYRGQRMVVRSIHRSAGGALPLQVPLGYMFIADGREVGAVDLNGPNKTIMAPRGGPYREAVIAGGLALSIFWDPAEVQGDY